MKTIKISIFFVIMVTSLPFSGLHALGATDKKVLELFGQSKEIIAPHYIRLLEKEEQLQARIKELENTIEERSFTKGRHNGWIEAGLIVGGSVAVFALFIIANQSKKIRY